MKKIWTYIISKSLSDEELNLILKQGEKFVSNWISHENKLDASFKIYKNRIIIVEVNEHVFQASGCGIDKLTRFIKEIEIVFNIELLNRLLVAYQAEEKIEVVHSSKIKDLLTENKINPNKSRLPTNEEIAKIWACLKCAHKETEGMKVLKFADPSKCHHCNP